MKSNQLAENYLLKANDAFAAKKYKEALENFNQCLRFGINKSQYIADALSGRANVYKELKEFEICLNNTLTAIDSCDDDNKCKSLKKLRDECDEKLKNISSEKRSDNDTSFFKLSKEPNKKIPWISDCLEVRENEVYGRFIVTTRDLNPGDLVVFEEPFYKVLSFDQRHIRCAICLKCNLMNLSPCAKCDAMFCSKKCSDSIVHRYECNIPQRENSFEKLLLQRMFYQAVEIAGSLEELQKLMSRETSAKTIMDFDLSDPNNPMNEKNRVLAMTSLAEREPWSAEAYAKYESVTQQLKAETEDERDFLRNYLVRCLKSMTVNFFHFFWSPGQLEGQGFALCSLAAYFAHSCDPNVDKIDVDNKFAFVTRKPIKGGEQLFMNYDRYSFLTHSIDERQEYFSKIYTFSCKCSACVNDYPKLSDLPKFDPSFVITENETQVENAKEQFKKNCDYISLNIDHYPSFEICSLMVQNNQLLHIIGNKLPF